MFSSSLRFVSRLHITPAAFFSSTEKKGMTGVVKWFDAKKGFGFVTCDDGTPDVFVHYSTIHSHGFKSLAEGEQIEFDVIEADGGRVQAVNVTGPGGVPVQGKPPPPPRYGGDYGGGFDRGSRGGFGGGDNWN